MNLLSGSAPDQKSAGGGRDRVRVSHDGDPRAIKPWGGGSCLLRGRVILLETGHREKRRGGGASEMFITS